MDVRYCKHLWPPTKVQTISLYIHEVGYTYLRPHIFQLPGRFYSSQQHTLIISRNLSMKYEYNLVTLIMECNPTIDNIAPLKILNANMNRRGRRFGNYYSTPAHHIFAVEKILLLFNCLRRQKLWSFHKQKTWFMLTSSN